MTLYLTDSTPPEEIRRAKHSGIVHGVKLYPAGATTHSDAGVTRLEHTYPALEAMQEAGLPLLVHGEVTDAGVDIFDREHLFIERQLAPLVERFPGLRIVFEHITSSEAVDFVLAAPPRIAATITAHHLLLNRNDMLVGGIRPHHYCLPVLKRERDRSALLRAATSGNPKFFLGTDSAPHPRAAKKPPAAAPEFTRRMPPWNSMRRPSSKPGHWTNSKVLPPFTAPISTACPAIPRPSP